MDMPTAPAFAPSRAAALERLEAFAPAMGTAYAKRRNYDLGPGQHSGVSGLSPYVRRRMVTEAELVAAALARHSPSSAGKFIQEVFWRSYFRGWLERRPGVWDAYRRGLERDLAEVAANRGLAKRLREAEEGRTGLDCFDAWAEELVETGYLHNHARMWFASIWVFTLRLPWRLGADLFLRHLLDGCPASNTLGWRWVAGLHTKGKTYQAQAWNIAKFTKGRFAPDERELADRAEALVDPDPLPPAPPPRLPLEEDLSRPTALLVTEEDLRPEDLGLARSDLAGVATLAASAGRSPRPVSDGVAAFEAAALADCAERLRAAGAPAAEILDPLGSHALADWAHRAGATQIVMPYQPVGPAQDWLAAQRPAVEAAGVRIVELRRQWDDLVWPHATAGYFKVKSKIPEILGTLALSA